MHRGRPALSIASFYKHASANPTPPIVAPTPDPSTLDPAHVTPNAWLQLLQTRLVHENEHLLKIQRSLGHYAAVYGAAPAGRFAGTGLAGTEQLDGTLFVRVAGLTADYLGWTREGQKGEWSFAGF